ncbi:MAG: hypothetical protein ABIH52_04075 [Candidatus Aenigmatarchaeota archaeon]|nr:hypothetical protein [Nanoarchaeota archaeon]
MQNTQIFGYKCAVKGWLSGSLIFGGILGDFGFVVQAILFIIGALILLDTVFPFGTNMFGLSMIILFVIGALFSFQFLLMNVLVYYMGLCLVIVILGYLVSALKKHKLNFITPENTN